MSTYLVKMLRGSKPGGVALFYEPILRDDEKLERLHWFEEQ